MSENQVVDELDTVEYLGLIRLQNTTPPHNKFYEIVLEKSSVGYIILTRYGRIGKDSVWNRMEGLTSVTARKLIADLIKARNKHGYYLSESPTLEIPKA